MRAFASYFFFVISILGASLVRAKESPNAIFPGLHPDGSVTLPNQWTLRPTGKQINMGDFPQNLALHPAGVFAAVLHAGWGRHEVRILDLKKGQVVSEVAINDTFYGISWSPKGDELYVSGSGDECVHVFKFKKGFLSDERTLTLNPEKEEGIPAGVVASADGESLYVAEVWGQRVRKVSLRDGKSLWLLRLAEPLGKSEMEAEGERTKTRQDRLAPFPYTCLEDTQRHLVFVTLWGEAKVLVLDANTGVEKARWAVGSHPNEMALSQDGRLFVAEANLNTVSAIDVKTGRVVEQLSASLYPASPPGSMPNSLALSSDDQLLFVANANNNNIAVFDVSTKSKTVSLGFIPVGWFPTSVRVSEDGKHLIVANGKGVTSEANPRGPYPGTPAPRNLQEYIGGLMQGTVSVIDLPTSKDRAAAFGEWTKIAYTCSPLNATATPRAGRPEGNPIPAKVGDASPIKYVLYIVRENRTYDQVLGDMPEGNGARHLCLFPEKVTPNAHALARQFVLLDNFFADGEVSADGHEWSLGAYATDFVEKMWPLNYGHNAKKKHAYPSEGQYPIAYPANGYLWNRAAEANVSYRSYGEFCNTLKKGPEQSEPALPILKGHIDAYYRGWDLDFPDVKRADRFTSELHRYEKEGDMPRLQVLRLGNDHTSGTKVGARTPTAMVADNDAGLGLIIEAISKSKFWPEIAIFVLEDDAQNGPDHVDAHRMPALAISAYTRRGVVDSSLYSTTSMLRTMELILGLQPMSQFDAAALPMWAAFQEKPDLSGYTAKPPEVDVTEKNTKLAWGAKESQRMDFSQPDRVDDFQLNETVWRSVRGHHSPMPAPVHAAFFKAHPPSDDDD